MFCLVQRPRVSVEGVAARSAKNLLNAAVNSQVLVPLDNQNFHSSSSQQEHLITNDYEVVLNVPIDQNGFTFSNGEQNRQEANSEELRLMKETNEGTYVKPTYTYIYITYVYYCLLL